MIKFRNKIKRFLILMNKCIDYKYNNKKINLQYKSNFQKIKILNSNSKLINQKLRKIKIINLMIKFSN